MTPITIVSGLPRSGTSMMMKMLEAGGMTIFHDNIRTADADNPKGYYEYEKVKNLARDAKWLPEAEGKVIKIISSLLPHLLDDLEYNIIFMQRQIEEVLASQKKMLSRSNLPPGDVTDQVMAAKFSMHLRKVKKQLTERKSTRVLYINYTDVLSEPDSAAEKIYNFLKTTELDPEKMAQVVDPNLYRNRIQSAD